MNNNEVKTFWVRYDIESELFPGMTAAFPISCTEEEGMLYIALLEETRYGINNPELLDINCPDELENIQNRTPLLRELILEVIRECSTELFYKKRYIEGLIEQADKVLENAKETTYDN